MAGPERRLDLDRVNTLVQTLAILGAGAWGIYTFIYEARIKPGLAPPAVSVTTGLAKAGERDGHVAIRSTVTRRNVGETGVRVLGLVYTVTGIRARFGADAAPTDRSGPAGSLAAARGYTLDEPGTVILRQGKLFAGAADGAEPSDLNPGEAVSRDSIFYADAKAYDFVRFEVSFVYTKEDDPPVRLRFETEASGRLALRPQGDCRAEACDRLRTTDFATEFSLW
ncbi:hypothetical protein [Methylobacterium frigidaeris]|uniref:Uncharacterized protein n=1 Tax=Methylobacterium frigidaeris TaxID=2038277 RepID=A0AA37HBJ5_9HYPH|nr:hypothetical protein [Methylobacterium frigidaeris]PIK74352.1 hypothetical protein CS379_02985 [Methylobacterium frigidaeris]GJD62804.1 hypothetical protein MPEAHAMD_2963 [Methylobacterium frigidaeris]